MPPTDVHLLGEAVAVHARRRASHVALVFLENGDDESARLDYGLLEARVVRVASGLVARGLRGKSLVIALPPGADFVVLFLACLRSGVVAIPVPYPDTFRHIARIAAVASDARPAAIVSDDAGLAKCPDGLPRMTMSGLTGTEIDIQAARPSDIAFVQYTSGSTQAPKGVAITNANLVANIRMIAAGASLNEQCIAATWLPHFHDMGLIGGLCLPLFLGGSAITMPPQAFVKRPLRWLNVMHRYRANLSGGPCFGYDICARRLGHAASALDLSAWKIAYCGAEPVRAPILKRFADLLAPAKFDSAAFLPCYGLAEATLMATCPRPGTGVREVVLDRPGAGGRRTFVACGPAMPDSRIRVRSSSGGWAEDGELGEICIAGQHVSPGFWNGEGNAPRPFPDLVLDGDSTYLRTGDIGALVGGDVVPVDRLKDLIVVYGRKIHATDIEATVLDACAAIPAAAAVGVDRETEERLVVFCEVRQADMPSVDIENLAAAVSTAHGIVPDIRLVLPGSLVRTSSGKIARFASKERLLPIQPEAPRALRAGSGVSQAGESGE